MSSSEKWFPMPATVNGKLDSIFRGIRVLNYTGLESLANLILNPNPLESFFSKPDDWISTCMYYPYSIPLRSGSGTALKLQLGLYKTDIDCYDLLIWSELYNMGELLIQPHFNNFADYDGYSKLEVWLPFLGTVEVSLNDVIGKYLKFVLGVDYLSGQGTWYICVGDTPNSSTDLLINLADGFNYRILSTHTCQIGMELPIGSTNTANVYRNIIMGAVKGVSTALSSYAISSLGATGGTSKSKEIKTARNKTTGRQITTATKKTETTYDGSNYQFGKSVVGCFDYATDSLNNMHISASTDRSNNPVSMFNACNSIKVIRYYPKIVPTNEDYGKLYGYPLGKTVTLSTLSGYTEISNIHIEGEGFKSATQKEIAMIKEALSDGIII